MDDKQFGAYLKSLMKQKKLTARQLDLYSGVSHSYISQLTRGARGIPSPDILLKLSKPLGVEYEELMQIAGYIDGTKKEAASATPKSKLDLAVERIENDFNVSITDDPLIMKALEGYIETLANIKKNNSTEDR